MTLDPHDDRLVGRRDLRQWPTGIGKLLARLASRVGSLHGPQAVLYGTLLIGGLLLIGLTVATGELYESVVDADGAAVVDVPALALAKRLRSPHADAAVTFYTDIGSARVLPVLVAVAVLVMTVRWRQWTPLVLVVCATTGSVLMTVLGKSAVGRARPALADAVPPYESSASFPSGHALNAVVVAGVLAYLLVCHQRRAWARATTVSAASAFASTMGLSRVYLGHHWVTDVLVAWTLGLAWLTVVVLAHRLFLTVHRDRQAQPARA